jgi:hypothetical protein
MKNLAEDRTQNAKVAHYRERLTKWRREHNDTFEACTWYESRWTKDRNITNTATGVGQNLKKLDSLMTKYYSA